MNKRKYNDEFLLRRFDDRKIESVKKKHRIYNDLSGIIYRNMESVEIKRIGKCEEKEFDIKELSNDEIYEIYY